MMLFGLLSILIVLPYFHGGVVYNQFDLQFHISSIQENYLNVKNGNWTHILPDINTKTFGNFGYPNSLFYPIFTFLPEIFIHLIFKSAWISYLIFAIIANFLILLSMFILCRKLSISMIPSIIGSLIYEFSGFNQIWQFNNEDISQVMVLIFLPIAFYGVYQIILGNYKKWYILSIGMFLICMTHLVSLVMVSMFVLFLALYVLFTNFNLREKVVRIITLIISAVVTLLLSAFFLVLLLFNMHYVGNISVFVIQLDKFAINLQNFFFNYLPNNNLETNWTQLSGIGILGLVAIALICVAWKHLSREYRYLVLGLIIFSLLTTNLFPWNLFQNVMQFLQFPIRFMLIVSFLLAILGAKSTQIVLENNLLSSSKNFGIFFVILISSIGIIFTTSTTEYLKHSGRQVLSTEEFEKVSPEWDTLDYLPQVSQPIRDDLFKHSIPKMNTKQKGLKQGEYLTSYDQVSYQLRSNKDLSSIRLPNIYYPGFHAYVNNKEVPIKVDKNKAINIPVRKGINNIDIVYKKTITQIVTLWISIIIWIVLIGWIVYKKLFNRKIKHKKLYK
ncbi:hypothetical protein IV37_GL000566 [Fructilactobacillus fructivorans]|uniref:YfhO family protein n=1 Tax=Fructilactobacillus fructivorans TaxID=1614 RepID=UPI000704F021|nr:YfhO family protein [Fructilactobacillus fructivorans]KRN12934.1 hypothetical protein IV37_GL000566 [Fructilactobacillus fructivorans]